MIGDVDAALRALSRACRTTRLLRVAGVPAMIIAVMLLGASLPALFGPAWGDATYAVLGAATLGLCLGLAGLRGWRVQREATGRLTGSDRPDAVGALAEAMYEGPMQNRDLAGGALAHCLTGFTSDDYRALTARQRSCLLSLPLALAAADPRLAVRVIGVLGCVAGPEALGWLQRVAARTGGRDGGNWVADAACLAEAAIRERIVIEAATAALLRPVAGVNPAPLLRPAGQPHEPNTTALLRPSEPSGADRPPPAEG